MTITAIETRYAGCRFRSRLEARWAVFFDHLGIRWEYEPQGFAVNGNPYLPDFHLPSQDQFPREAWIEVKPKNDDPACEFHSFAEAVAETGYPSGVAYLFAGDIPNPDLFIPRDGMFGPICDYRERGRPGALHIEIYGDHQYAWCSCTTGQHFGIEFSATGERIECECNERQREDCCTGDHPKLVAAYRAARSARFEHGERGR